MRQWRSVDEKRLFSHALFELYKRRLEADGERRDAMVLKAPDWVNVIPVLDDGRVLLIRQWRYGSESFTLEIPGGMVEHDDEEGHREAALRELLEETGYRAAAIEPLGTLDPNPAFMTNRVSSWLATGLEQVFDEIPGDGQEEIRLTARPLSEIPQLIAAGQITHSLVVAAFHLLSLSGSGRGR